MDPERHASVWCTSIQSIGFSPDKGTDAGNVTTGNNVLNCSRYQEYVHEQPRINSSSETEVVNVIEPKCCFSCETQASSKPGSSKPKEMTTMDTDDLSQLVGALNEDAVIKLLQSRFKKGLYFTKVGPVLLLVNPCDTVLPPHPLACSTIRGQEYLKEMVTTAAAQLAETAHTQVITLSGESGSGKSSTICGLLQQMYDVLGGGIATDAYKQLSATITVLRSLGCAATSMNQDSTRIGYYFESQVSDELLYRTKVHCYFLDQGRAVGAGSRGKNYHIFYQLLAGLSKEERNKFHLDTHTIQSLNYLKDGSHSCDEKMDKERYNAWKASLAELGIPFSDLIRILAAVLLLGNVKFEQDGFGQLQVTTHQEIKAVAGLLGVSGLSLYRGLTTVSKSIKGDIIKQAACPSKAYKNRDDLAKALYKRAVMAVVRRANSLRRLSSEFSLSIDSSDTSMTGLGSSSSMKSASPGIGPQEGVIGLLEMFGFENLQENGLEQMCANLCAETIQHFYNSHVFRTPANSYLEEGLQDVMEIPFFDNAPLITFISSQKTGILHLLDSVYINTGSAEDFLHSLEQQLAVRTDSNKYIEVNEDNQSFIIKHYSCPVKYNTLAMLEANTDELDENVIGIFSKQNCNFGFVAHLFSSELRKMQGTGGGCYRVSTGATGCDNSQGRTFSQDFHCSLDNLLKAIASAEPHFITCLKSNLKGEACMFDEDHILQQTRALQIAETVQLMAGGLPHRMRFRSFCNRYWFLIPFNKRKDKRAEKPEILCKTVLENYLKIMDENDQPYTSANWMFGKRSVFFSESARQQFEKSRKELFHRAAIVIQTAWRRVKCVKGWPLLKKQLEMRKRRRTPVSGFKSRRRSKTATCISYKQSALSQISCNKTDEELKTFQHFANVYGLETVTAPPPVPNKREYTVVGNMKHGFPQRRKMKESFSDGHGILYKGEVVNVQGPSSAIPGALLVSSGKRTTQVPYHYTEFSASYLDASGTFAGQDEGVCI